MIRRGISNFLLSISLSLGLWGCYPISDCFYGSLDYATVTFFQQEGSEQIPAALVFDSIIVRHRRAQQPLSEVLLQAEPLRLPLDIDTTETTFLFYKERRARQLTLSYRVELNRVEEACGTQLHIWIDQVRRHDFTKVDIKHHELVAIEDAHLEITL